MFLAKSWEGEVKESEEIRPAWFLTEEIPFDDMWADAGYWLADVLRWIKLTGKFLFDENLMVSDYEIYKL